MQDEQRKGSRQSKRVRSIDVSVKQLLRSLYWRGVHCGDLNLSYRTVFACERATALFFSSGDWWRSLTHVHPALKLFRHARLLPQQQQGVLHYQRATHVKLATCTVRYKVRRRHTYSLVFRVTKQYHSTPVLDLVWLEIAAPRPRTERVIAAGPGSISNKKKTSEKGSLSRVATGI